MDNQLNGLPIQQACESAPKNQEMQKQTEEREQITEEQREGAERFKLLSVGCFLYALFYTFCLYQNKSGITYPFLIGGTLYFFGYYFKRFGATAARDKSFLAGAMILLGILNCTTDSDVLIFFNRLMLVFLLGVLILERFHDSIRWKLGTWGKALTHLLFGSISQIYRPIEDLYWNYKLKEKKEEATPESKERKRKILYGLLGVGCSLPVLFILMLLLGSADALFYELICDIWDTLFSWSLPEFLKNEDFPGIMWMLLCSFLGIYGLLTYAGKRNYIENAVKTTPVEWEAFLAIAFLSLITIVYCVFCGIQIFGLFLGWMTLPEGYTYASYARQGFFQLLFVCLFNIGLVLGCLGLFKKNKWLQALLTLISVCTYIMVASSAYRMILYINSYQLTFFRVFVLWALLMIALVMGGVIRYIWCQQFGLFRYLLTTVVIGYITFAAVHPDYWIAKYNINQLVQGEESDLLYLTCNLSTDAAPAVLELLSDEYPQEQKAQVTGALIRYEERIEEKTADMHIRNWNVSRAYAEWISKKKP